MNYNNKPLFRIDDQLLLSSTAFTYLGKLLIFASPFVFLMRWLLDSIYAGASNAEHAKIIAFFFLIAGSLFLLFSLFRTVQLSVIESCSFYFLRLVIVALIILNTGCISLLDNNLPNIQYFRVLVGVVLICICIREYIKYSVFDFDEDYRKFSNRIEIYNPSHEDVVYQAANQKINIVEDWVENLAISFAGLAYAVQSILSTSFGRNWALFFAGIFFSITFVALIQQAVHIYCCYYKPAFRYQKLTGKPVVFEGTWEAYKASRGL